MSYHLVDVVQQFGRPRVLVLGDLILDRYVWGDAERVSQEAPVLLIREDRQETRLGGAANVAQMLKGLKATVTMAGVIGADAEGESIIVALDAAGIDTSLVHRDAGRPTTTKQRIIGRAQQLHPHQVLRIDRESRAALADEIERRFLAAVLPRIAGHQAVLVSDYAKGVCTPQVLATVIAAAADAGVPVVIDPATGTDHRHYRGATAITPNRSETEKLVGRTIGTPAEALAAGAELCDQLDLDATFVTIDSDGIALVRRDGRREHLSTRRREVYDITGAGDMVLATIGIGIAAGIDLADVARLANVAGGLEVEQVGVVTISRDQIIAACRRGVRDTASKVLTLAKLVGQLAGRRQAGQRIVLTNGCFDLWHAGHLEVLTRAAAEGDCLVVAVNSDESVRGLGKGPDRPITPDVQRAALLAALAGVDYVTVFDDETPLEVIRAVRPDVLVKGGTYRLDQVVGADLVKAEGGEVKVLGLIEGLSTSALIARIRERPSEQRRKAG